MPTDPETALALAAAVQRAARWTRAEMPLSPADSVALVRRFEVAAHAEVERGVRRVREEGRDWAAVAVLLQLDALPRTAGDAAALAFAYCAGLLSRSVMPSSMPDTVAAVCHAADRPADRLLTRGRTEGLDEARRA